MSKYKPYPKYKDSGVEWLGEIPEHWTTPKLKLFISTTKGFAFKSNDFIEEGVPVVKMSEIKNGTINESSVFLPERFKQSHKKVMLTYQDIVVSTVGSSAEVKNSAVGQIGIVPEIHNESLLNQNTVVFSPNRKVLSNSYLPYVLKSQAYREHLDLHAHGTANQASLNLEDMLKFVFSFPPLQEQKTIATYLDIATAKIDTLIEKQTRLIALLKEKRQAVISTAVTRGLDSSVPMKESGVEWLGEIPVGWEVKKLKYNLTLQTKKVEITNQQVIALENIAGWSGKYVATNSKYQGDDVEFQSGDILFGKLRPYLAKVYKADEEGVAFGDILVYRPNQFTDATFAFYTMISETFIDIVDGSTYGSKMPRASVDFVSDMPMATPAKQEQEKIANYLDDKTQKIDNLITKATKAIDLLKERRTALISAVVTGKVDVRNEDKGEI